MRRWTARLAGGVIALGVVGGVGCKHQLFTEPADSPLLNRPDIPARLDTHPHDPILPASAAVAVPPPNVLDLKRQPRFISLKEAMAVAVERGNTGSANLSGQVSDALPQAGQAFTDTIRAFLLDPAVAATNMERSLSKFDARWITQMSWNKADQAVVNQLQQGFQNGDQAAFLTTLAKPLPTGGVAGITTTVNYSLLQSPPTGFITLNPNYTTRMQFVFEQPLLQGFGVEANQLLPNHPGSLLIQGFRSTGQGTEGILISRVRADQAREQFNLQVNNLLINVEAAYWELYAAYHNLAAREEGLRAAFRALDFNTPRVEQGVEEPQLKPQLEQQYWQFYAQVIEARGRVLEADRALRGLMGLRSDDGTVFAPADEPLKAPVKFDTAANYQEGLQTRPEVLIARQELKARQLDLRGQRYARMPDLRLFSSYDLNGIGSQLAGTGQNAQGQPIGAINSLGTNQFNSWQVGLRLDIPLGFRDANAIVRQAQLNMWRAFYTLSDTERKVFEILTRSERAAYQQYQSILAQRRVKVAAEERVKLIETRIVAGQFTGGAQYLQLTQAQQDLANATAAEFQAIANYNTELARIEYAKGTIQRYNNISVADGPLPAFVQKKAADHFRERQAGLKLREHPADAGTLAGFEFAPLNEMNEKMLGGGAVPPAPGAGALPPSLPPPLMMPGAGAGAGGTVKSYTEWNNSRDGTGASLPSTLPGPVTPPKPAGDAAAGTFVPHGTLTLPPKRTPGAEPPTTPTPPAGVPTTVPSIPPLPPIK